MNEMIYKSSSMKEIFSYENSPIIKSMQFLIIEKCLTQCLTKGVESDDK